MPPERVLLGERSSVIVLGHVSADQRARLRIRGCISVGDRVRFPEPPLIRLPISGPGLAYVQGPDAGAEHTHVFGTCNFGTARIHVGEHRIIRIGTASA